MTITELIKEAHETAVSKGWWEDEPHNGTLFMLMVTEIAEAVEEDRRGNTDKMATEIADVVIRIFDFCGARGIDLENYILEKMLFNKTRPYKHGDKKY